MEEVIRIRAEFCLFSQTNPNLEVEDLVDQGQHLM
jgi:hypothetical protein